MPCYSIYIFTYIYMERDWRDEIILEELEGLGLQIKIRHDGNNLHVRITLGKCWLLLLHIHDNNEKIWIEHLSKCEHVSGPFILDKVETLAKRIGVKEISLADASQVSVNVCGHKKEISLAVLYLLTKSMTWYNSKGYTARHGSETKGIREDQINMVMSDFIRDLIAIFKEDQYTDINYYLANKRENHKFIKVEDNGKVSDTQDDEGYVEYMYILLERILQRDHRLTMDIKVKDYFEIAKTILKNPSPTREECDLMIYLVELISYITESQILFEQFEMDATKNLLGAKNKKTKKKSRKNKKTKKQRRNNKSNILTFKL